MKRIGTKNVWLDDVKLSLEDRQMVEIKCREEALKKNKTIIEHDLKCTDSRIKKNRKN